VATPKSLLRQPKAVSSLTDFTQKSFQEILDDTNVTARSVKRVVLCSGKIYYDLLEKQEADKRKDIALVRIEQLFPIAYDQLEALRKNYARAEFVWVQEENEIMGAWPFYCR